MLQAHSITTTMITQSRVHSPVDDDVTSSTVAVVPITDTEPVVTDSVPPDVASPPAVTVIPPLAIVTPECTDRPAAMDTPPPAFTCTTSGKAMCEQTGRHVDSDVYSSPQRTIIILDEGVLKYLNAGTATRKLA